LATLTSAPEQRIVLHGVTWETFERLLADQADRSAPRFAYDRGDLENVSPSAEHEIVNRTLALLVELVASELGIEVLDVGSMTCKRRDLQRGFEPDSSFYVQNEDRVRGKTQIDIALDPPPDLVIEIDITHGTIAKLPIFAAVGVPEVWRWDGNRALILHLAENEYHDAVRSQSLPVLTSEDLTALLHESFSMRRTAWTHHVREWTRKQSSSL
jgi:Uma2 family endonuclease